jgi:hypothetical protein
MSLPLFMSAICLASNNDTQGQPPKMNGRRLMPFLDVVLRNTVRLRLPVMTVLTSAAHTALVVIVRAISVNITPPVSGWHASKASCCLWFTIR